MRTDNTDEFASALAAADVECTRTTAADLPGTLADVVTQPAVGAPLDVDGVSLADAPVETEVTPRRLDDAETGVTRVHGGVAEYGTFVVQADAAGTEPVALYPTEHVGVVCASDVRADVRSTVDWLGGEFDAGRDTAVLATGASATADMGELVTGVHGPQTVHAVLVTDR
ncbi:LUD domain-containing protein [Halobacterium yunchengense]|uniref:LUD domain-containing protein n=1 Tax=Halobacterium yunchengense TaxID=3108497 RepID=UPI00300B0AE2